MKKITKTIQSAALAFVLAAAALPLTGAPALAAAPPAASPRVPQVSGLPEIGAVCAGTVSTRISRAAAAFPPPDKPGAYYYNLLTAQERQAYDVMYGEAEALDTTTYGAFPNTITMASYKRAYTAFYYDNPQFFWLAPMFPYQTDGYTTLIAAARLLSIYYTTPYVDPDSGVTYDYGVADTGLIAKKQSELDAAAAKFPGVTAGMTDAQKVRIIHDKLVTQVGYDDTVYTDSEYEIHTIYGAMVNKSCVCDGFAFTLSYLLNSMGIDCYLVRGNAYVSGFPEAHAWNLLSLNGAWYDMDATWDENLYDPSYTVPYTYFCNPTSYMSSDYYRYRHVRETGVFTQALPTATAIKNDADFRLSDADFSVSAGGVLTRYNGVGGNVAVPVSAGGTAITAVGDYAFYQYGLTLTPPGPTEPPDAMIVSVALPAGLKSVGSNAFGYNPNLGIVDIPASVANIGAAAFANSPGVSVRGYAGSYAQTYANANGITFIPLSATAISVTGLVLSYDPANETTVQLMQNGTVVYPAVIPAAGGTGQVSQRFTFSGVAPGTYTLIVTKRAHAKYTLNNLAVGDADIDLTMDSRPAISKITLPCGDIDGDGSVTARDLSTLLAVGNYSKYVSVATNPSADLDGDGMITSRDLSILLGTNNYSKGPVSVNY